jgi:adenylate cyclase
MMPGITGIDVLRRLRSSSSESDLPVIMATAREATEDVVEALRLGANDYVTKPLDFPVVLARVETQLALKRQKEEIRRLAEDLGRRNRFIQRTFGRYLSEEIVENLLDSPDGLRLGGEQRRVTILMADLRGFTSLTDTMGPEQVVRVLNAYLGTMAEVILRYQGTIDEFIGDAILAIFGAPLRRQDDARRALACAVAMQLSMEELNRRFESEGLPRIQMGVAVHTGEVVVGNIGSEKRSKYGVVGSPVNHTGRIESFTVGGQILISEATRLEAGELVQVGESLTIDAKGAREPLVVHELRGIKGEFDVFLPEREDRPVRLASPIAASYHVLEDKRVGSESYQALFTELSTWGGLMQSDRRLRPLSNLKLQFEPPEGLKLPGDVYAKVVDARGDDQELLYLRFTSVPPAVDAWLKGLAPKRP